MEYSVVNIRGISVRVKRANNLEIFSFDDESTVPEPKVPQFYIEKRNSYIDNPDHPVYREALKVYAADRILRMTDLIVEKYIDLDYDPPIDKRLKRVYPDKSSKFLYLRHYLLNDDDLADIVNLMCLTETRVYHIFNSLKVLRNGVNIHEHVIKNSITTNIEYESVVISSHQLVNPIEEYSACKGSNMSWGDWINGKFTLDQMASAIALFRMDKIVSMHTSDAEQEYVSRKNKSKGAT